MRTIERSVASVADAAAAVFAGRAAQFAGGPRLGALHRLDAEPDLLRALLGGTDPDAVRAALLDGEAVPLSAGGWSGSLEASGRWVPAEPQPGAPDLTAEHWETTLALTLRRRAPHRGGLLLEERLRTAFQVGLAGAVDGPPALRLSETLESPAPYLATLQRVVATSPRGLALASDGLPGLRSGDFTFVRDATPVAAVHLTPAPEGRSRLELSIDDPGGNTLRSAKAIDRAAHGWLGAGVTRLAAARPAERPDIGVA